jgi:hypothetical protein
MIKSKTEIARSQNLARQRRFREKIAKANFKRVEVIIFDTTENRNRLIRFVEGLQE